MSNKTLSYYNQNASKFISDTVNAEMESKLDLFLNAIQDLHKDTDPNGLSLLDLGCGSGRDTKYFLQHGYHVTAMDGSKELVKIASAYTGINIEQMDFHEFHAQDAYDGIWACASILHLPMKDLPDMFQSIYLALRKDGVFYTSMKYGDFEGDRNGRYYTDLNEERMEVILHTVPGFRIIKEWTSSDVRPGRNQEKWLNILLQRD